MMDLLILFVSITIGMLIFLLLIVLYQLIKLRKTQAYSAWTSRVTDDWQMHIQPFLTLFPLPAGLIPRWGGLSVQTNLAHAGVPWKVQDYVAFRWLCLWVAGALGLYIGIIYSWGLLSQVLAVLLFSTGYLAPQVWLDRRREQRCETVDLSLPNFLDRLTLSMEAGLGFEIALRRTSQHFPGLLGDELRHLIRTLERGHTRAEALDQLVERTPSTNLAAFVAAVKQSDRLGTSLARTLRIQSQLLRARWKRQAEEAGRRVPILIVFPLVFFFLPALLIIYLAPPILHLFFGR